jgi:methyl-accepting chemotaxis protein
VNIKLGIRSKLLLSFSIVLVLSGLIAFAGWRGLSDSNDRLASVYGDQFQGEVLLSRMSQDALKMRTGALRHLLAPDAAAMSAIEADIASLDQDFLSAIDESFAADTDGVDHPAIQQVKDAFTAYAAARDTQVIAVNRTGDRQTADAAATGPVGALFKALDSSLTDAESTKIETAKTNYEASMAAAGQSTVILFAVLLLAILLGLGIAFLVARGLANGATAVQETVRSLAEKCTTWLQEGLARLAANDFTYDITPVTPLIEKYSSDEIGQTAALTNQLRNNIVASIGAYNEARAGLTATIVEVREAAESVARTSGQLNEAATQSGAAVQQVATTIQQVAAGAADQARAASETSSAVSELTGVITGVGASAASTTRKVEAASATIEQMTVAITAASAASTEVGEVSSSAASAADNGATAVRETVAGMGRIKKAVDVSAVKVTELGAKGEQIGAIVETINDIAEQTNLLALNAAIEAARAGEQGKGFAVVADEVRAERSGRATKEIAALIAEVQAGTKDAVAAMQTGAAEVETGTELAARSGAALEQIATAVSATRSAVARIIKAVEAMSTSSAGVVSAIDEIAVIADANNQAAATMTANAGSVSRSVESIAAVSEENSAAAEEVSAATEEMSAQAEEVVASASTLAEMAATLDELVARFTLDDGGTTTAKGKASVVQRRRSADWKKAAA